MVFGKLDTLSPEQIREREEKEKANFEFFNRELGLMAERLGYEEMSSLEDLELTEDEIKKICWARSCLMKDDPIYKGNPRFFRAARKDGSKVAAIIEALRCEIKPTFAADIFSPNNYEGHGGNHDFAGWELEENLKTALTSPNYPK